MTPKILEHAFRLTLRSRPSPLNVVFTSTRTGFRGSLASALLDLRMKDSQSALVLEIGAHIGSGGEVEWLRLRSKPKDELVELSHPIRWESIACLYDDYVRLHNVFTEARSGAHAEMPAL